MKYILEKNVFKKNPRGKLRIALVYPNLYKVGMSNLGFRIVYDMLNSLDYVYCERFFIDFERTLETNSPLRDFDIIAFCYQFENDLLNIIEIIDKYNIWNKVKIAGGPCTVNPYPIKKFVDYVFIGEAEANLIDFIEAFAEGCRNGDIEKIDGVYVSSRDNKTKKVFMRNLDEYFPTAQISSEHTAFNDVFLLEISRGCAWNCRFCMGTHIFKPRRERSLEKLVEIVEKGVEMNKPKKISLIGASVSDYSKIDELSEYLSEYADRGIEISAPSLRADTIKESLLDLLARSKQKTITIAPESSEDIRYMLNKKISNEDLLNACRLAKKSGIRKVKLYFIVGLPNESEKDLNEIVKIVESIKKLGLWVKVSINPFIPKPHTPMQFFAFEDPKILRKKIEFLRRNIKAEVEFEDLKSAIIQAVIARGDEKLGEILYRTYKYGKSFSAMKKAFKDFKINLNKYLEERDPEEKLPWEKIDVGISKTFFIKEYEKMLSI